MNKNHQYKEVIQLIQFNLALKQSQIKKQVNNKWNHKFQLMIITQKKIIKYSSLINFTYLQMIQIRQQFIMGSCSNKQDKHDTKKRAVRKNTHVMSKQQRQQLYASNNHKPHPTTQQELRQTIYEFFAKYDTNHDGFLDKKEVEIMLTQLYSHAKHHNNRNPKQDVSNIFNAADQNHDKCINKQEFYRFYKEKMSQ